MRSIIIILLFISPLSYSQVSLSLGISELIEGQLYSRKYNPGNIDNDYQPDNDLKVNLNTCYKLGIDYNLKKWMHSTSVYLSTNSYSSLDRTFASKTQGGFFGSHKSWTYSYSANNEASYLGFKYSLNRVTLENNFKILLGFFVRFDFLIAESESNHTQRIDYHHSGTSPGPVSTQYSYDTETFIYDEFDATTNLKANGSIGLNINLRYNLPRIFFEIPISFGFGILPRNYNNQLNTSDMGPYSTDVLFWIFPNFEIGFKTGITFKKRKEIQSE